jgi:hypothetical protein
MEEVITNHQSQKTKNTEKDGRLKDSFQKSKENSIS